MLMHTLGVSEFYRIGQVYFGLFHLPPPQTQMSFFAALNLNIINGFFESSKFSCWNEQLNYSL